MRELAIRLSALFIGATLVLMAVAYLDHSNLSSRDSETDNVTDIALNVVLNDPEVQKTISQFDNHYTVVAFRQINTNSSKGFIDYPGNLVGVYIQSTPPRGPPPLVNFYFIVDTNRSLTVDRASWLDSPPYDDVLIPPGSAWYHGVISAGQGFTGAGAVPESYFNSSYSPIDANVSQYLVDEEGLYRLMNLSQVTSLRELDVPEYVTVYNRTETQGPKWNATIRWPAVEVVQGPGTGISSEPIYSTDKNYYIVVINRELSRDVGLSQLAFTGSLW